MSLRRRIVRRHRPDLDPTEQIEWHIAALFAAPIVVAVLLVWWAVRQSNLVLQVIP